MRPIARMARLLYPADDALQQALHLPRTLRTEELVGAATSMAEALASRVDRFLAAGLAKDALEQLVAAGDELRSIATTRALDRARRVAATEGIREAVQRGLVVLQLLDALVHLPLESNLSQRAEWRALMRRGRRRGGAGAGNAGGAAAAPGEQAVASTGAYFPAGLEEARRTAA